MKKALILILACVMLLSFAACGKTEAPAQQTEAPVEATPAAVSEAPVVEAKETAEAVVDPASLNLGVSNDEKHSGDAWYKDGTDTNSYIYLAKADNSGSGLACTLMVNGEPSKTWLCKETSDKHLVDQDAEAGKSEIDLVFTDIFTAVNNVDGSKYVRGNAETVSSLFVGKQLAEQENSANTLIFNADGTGKEVYDGKEADLTWKIDSGSTMMFNDGENDFHMTISVDDSGNFVKLYELNFRTYLPAA